ncbi:MAG: hypothetical protein ABEK01_01135 [Candidatus Nanohaloarchaea archaeon]
MELYGRELDREQVKGLVGIGIVLAFAVLLPPFLQVRYGYPIQLTAGAVIVVLFVVQQLMKRDLV